MRLDTAQRGVAAGMAAALAVSAAVLGGAYVFHPFGVPHLGGAAERLQYVLKADVVVMLWLLASIGNVARARFFSPADIDGSGLSTASPRLRIHAAVLQNTLEQTVLAVGAHLCLAATADGELMVLVWPLVALFSLGRLAFWLGYARGAAGRAFGFGATFYPSAFAVLLALVLLIT